jgi:hypothetical protein
LVQLTGNILDADGFDSHNLIGLQPPQLVDKTVLTAQHVAIGYILIEPRYQELICGNYIKIEAN